MHLVLKKKSGLQNCYQREVALYDYEIVMSYPLCSLPGLESLEIHRSCLSGPFNVQFWLLGLQQLHLVNTKIGRGWISTLQSLASRVTKLELRGCWMHEEIDDWEREDLMKPSRTLQYDSLNLL